ncbi:MAG: LPS-assembly protein LptD [Candidatus Saganbacteria bacterium]|nr:LPS-assembly protein LptD [Candidatus Saganbacteria bacterium]
MKKWLSAGLLALTLTFPLYAQIKDLTINGDKLSYDRAGQRVEATGSVEATYKDVVLRGHHLIYNTSAEAFHADQGFTFLYGGMTFEGQALDYELNSRAGTAEGANFFYQGVFLGGKRLIFNSEKFELKDAYFTNCDLPQPHYHITSSDIQLYPQDRWMVSYWGLFWLGRVPVALMPTYIYDFTGTTRQQTPFPDIGSNGEDGNYLTETLAWNLGRSLNGTYSLSYFSNKGVGLGGTANYQLNGWNSGNARLNWNAKDNTTGGLTHVVSFGDRLRETPRTTLDFGLFPSHRQYELQLTLSSRERINYQRVSFLPDLRFVSRGGSVGRSNVKYDYELNAGRVDEENNVRLKRGGGKLRFYEDFPDTPAGLLTPSLAWDALYYSNNTKWLKPSAGLDLTRSFNKDLALQLNYLHFLQIDGASPFLYENYRYRAADTLGSSLLLKIGETRAKVGAVYYLDNWSPEDIDYTLFFILHCYNLEVTYRSLRGEFLLGFSLAAP